VTRMLIGAMFFAFFVWLGVEAQAVPVNASAATSEYMSPLVGTSSYEITVGKTSAQSITYTGFYNAERRSQIRWVRVKHCDPANVDVPVCVALGPTASTVNCASGDDLGPNPGVSNANQGEPLWFKESATFLVSRMADGTAPALYAMASSATATLANGVVNMCVTVGW
jgi:hypothetical protein